MAAEWFSNDSDDQLGIGVNGLTTGRSVWPAYPWNVRRWLVVVQATWHAVAPEQSSGCPECPSELRLTGLAGMCSRSCHSAPGVDLGQKRQLIHTDGSAGKCQTERHLGSVLSRIFL